MARFLCFCRGDNITPPQQALDWILDLYDNVDEIVANGQTIIYSLHQSIGHLGVTVHIPPPRRRSGRAAIQAAAMAGIGGEGRLARAAAMSVQA